MYLCTVAYTGQVTFHKVSEKMFIWSGCIGPANIGRIYTETSPNFETDGEAFSDLTDKYHRHVLAKPTILFFILKIIIF